MLAGYVVRKVHWNTEAKACQLIRERVFIQEQNIDRALEWDGLDETSTHFLADYINANQSEVVGTCRLLPTGQIGRMAVLPEHRGTHTGRQLLEAAMAEARVQGHYRVFLHAQLAVEGFYAKLGFRRIGEEFEEAGIAHIEMDRELPLEFVSELKEKPGIKRPPHERVPDANDGRRVQRISQGNAFRQYLIATLAQARRAIRIFSRDLSRAIFDDEQVEQALSHFARSHPRVVVQILIVESGDAARTHHRIVELSRRLSSAIQIRKTATLNEESDEPPAQLVVADERTYLVVNSPDAMNGALVTDDPAGARQWISFFSHQWTYAKEDPNLRHLKI